MSRLYKKVKLFGPKGEVEVLALVDTGAGIGCALTLGTSEKIGLYPPERSVSLCGVTNCKPTKTGYVEVELSDCGRRKVEAIVCPDCPLDILGMDYLVESKAVIDTAKGEVTCSIPFKRTPRSEI